MTPRVFRYFFVLRIAPGNMARDSGTVRLDDIRDPEAGLAALSKDPPNETPESRKLRKLWQFQFKCWRDWLAGDSLAIPRAIYCCRNENQRPPRWLMNASVEFAEQGLSDTERERQNDFARHYRRWEAVEASKRRELRAREKPRTPTVWSTPVVDEVVDEVERDAIRTPRTKRMSLADHFERAKEVLSCDDAGANVDTITGSYKLIQRAGGATATFESYRRTAHKFNRRRRVGVTSPPDVTPKSL